jgi:hypothetical protein
MTDSLLLRYSFLYSNRHIDSILYVVCVMCMREKNSEKYIWSFGCFVSMHQIFNKSASLYLLIS